MKHSLVLLNTQTLVSTHKNIKQQKTPDGITRLQYCMPPPACRPTRSLWPRLWPF